jgi:hypothetical protein
MPFFAKLVFFDNKHAPFCHLSCCTVCKHIFQGCWLEKQPGIDLAFSKRHREGKITKPKDVFIEKMVFVISRSPKG